VKLLRADLYGARNAEVLLYTHSQA